MSENSYLRNKRIVITGGTGFIGSHLIERLAACETQAIRVVSSGSSTKRIANHLPKLDLKVYTNAQDYISTITAFMPDYIFILGGNSDPRLSLTNPRMDLEVNLLYNFDLLEKLSKEKSEAKIVYVSSVAVYADDTQPLREDGSPTAPKSPYGINKLAAEGYVRFFAQLHKLQAFSVRLSATYGPGLERQVVYDFIQKLKANPKRLSVLGDGTEVRDLCFVDDQVSGLLTLTEKAQYTGEIYNLGSGKGVTIAHLAQKIVKLMDLDATITFEKNKHEKHHGQTWVLDITKAKELGHMPQVTLDSGLKQTIDWVKNQ